MARKKTDKKRNALKVVEKLNRAPLKSKPADKKSWLQSYTGKKNTAARIVTALLVKGTTIEHCSEQALAFSKKKGNTWGALPDIKQHLKFLATKGCKINEDKGTFRVSQ